MEQRRDIPPPARYSPRKWKKSTKSARPRTRLPDNSSDHSNSDNKREHRRIRERRHQRRGCCRNAEQCKGFGAVLFTLGIPSSIAGVILTVVAATDDDDDNNKYPDSFLAVGPILLVFALVFFVSGLCLYNSYLGQMCNRCFSLDDPNGFCRMHCKKLSHWLKPDETIVINQAAMKALRTEPGKPVLKRGKLPSVASTGENGTADASVATGTGTASERNAHPISKGVRFSESDMEEIEKGHHSASSDSGSTLSLRHCKIYPKDEPDNIWWTDEVPPMEKRANNPPEDQTTEL